MRHIRSIARPHVVVIGAGWAGCAAAVSAAAAGARVTLLERTDMILGTGWSAALSRTTEVHCTRELRHGADLLLELWSPVSSMRESVSLGTSMHLSTM